jgi:hypothetical protein
MVKMAPVGEKGIGPVIHLVVAQFGNGCHNAPDDQRKGHKQEYLFPVIGFHQGKDRKLQGTSCPHF